VQILLGIKSFRISTYEFVEVSTLPGFKFVQFQLPGGRVFVARGTLPLRALHQTPHYYTTRHLYCQLDYSSGQ